MNWKVALAGFALYVLIAAGVFWLLGQITGSADMPLWMEVLWASTWPLIPLYLYIG